MKRVLIPIAFAALLVPFGTAQAKTLPKKSTASCAGVLAKNHRTLGAPKTQTNGSLHKSRQRMDFRCRTQPARLALSIRR